MKRAELLAAISVVKDFANNEKFSYPWVLLSTEYEGKVCSYADRGYAKIGTAIDAKDQYEKFSAKINAIQLHEALSAIKEEDVNLELSGASVSIVAKRQRVDLVSIGMDNTKEQADRFFAESNFGDLAICIPKATIKALLAHGHTMKAFIPPETLVQNQIVGGIWFRDSYACILPSGTVRQALFVKNVITPVDFVLHGRVGFSIAPKGDVHVYVSSETTNLIYDNTRVAYTTPSGLLASTTDKKFFQIPDYVNIGHVVLPDMQAFGKFGVNHIIWRETGIIEPENWRDCKYTETLDGQLTKTIMTPVLHIPTAEYNVDEAGVGYKFENDEIAYITGKIR